ncbi:MAG: hypothetical protein AAF004_07585 [Pseudomonadota bacterium]
MRLVLLIVAIHIAAAARAQLPQEDWDLEDGYRNDLLYVHALSNYAWDLEQQFAWERDQYIANAFRVNTGSVSSDRLFTDVNVAINEPLNEKWRFVGRFDRNGERRRSITTEQLQMGFERNVFNDSGVFVLLNPEYNKAFMDLAVGFATYRNERRHYLRLALLLRDFNYSSKNSEGGDETESDLAVQWQARWPLRNGWAIYSEGLVGRGFERRFDDPSLSGELQFLSQRNNAAELRVSRQSDDGSLWSAWVEWTDFSEEQRFGTPGFDYDYSNTETVVAAEHVRTINNKHRLRLLGSLTTRSATSTGFRQHDYDRTDVVAGAFYEYLRASSGIMIGYTAGAPDYEYIALEDDDTYRLGEFTDKLIVGFRYSFSHRAILRASVSQEVSQRGFGGGAIQYQMFF